MKPFIETLKEEEQRLTQILSSLRRTINTYERAPGIDIKQPVEPVVDPAKPIIAAVRLSDLEINEFKPNWTQKEKVMFALKPWYHDTGGTMDYERCWSVDDIVDYLFECEAFITELAQKIVIKTYVKHYCSLMRCEGKIFGWKKKDDLVGYTGNAFLYSLMPKPKPRPLF